MADGLEADAEAGLEQLDVVAELLGGAVEGGVRHEQGTGEVIGEADPGEACGLVGGEFTVGDQGVQQGAVFQQGELGGELEGALGLAEPGREQQETAVEVEPAGIGGPLGVGGDDGDAVAGGEVFLQCVGGAACRARAEVGRCAFGHLVEGAEVVVVGVEEIPYFVVGFGGEQGLAVLGGGEGDDAFGGVPVAVVQGDEGTGHLRMVAGHVGGLLQRHRGPARLVTEGSAQLGGEALLVGLGEEFRVDAEDLRDAQQHGRGQRAAAVLDLVEVAGGEAQRAGQLHLVHPALAAQPPQLGMGVDLASGRPSHGLGTPLPRPCLHSEALRCFLRK